MRIDERDNLNISKPQSERLFEAVKTESGPGYAAQTSGTTGDQIELGSQNGLLEQARAAGAESRASRMEQLRALVQSGQYQVDVTALSHAIVGAAVNGY